MAIVEEIVDMAQAESQNYLWRCVHVSLMVGAIVPDRELAELIQARARELGEEIPCVQASPEGLVGALRVIEPRGIRAVVSSGRLAELLRTATALPVVSLNPSAYDLLLALLEAKALSNKVALIHFGGLLLDIPRVSDALGIHIGEFASERSPQDVRKTLERVRLEGYDTVVSGPAIVSLARGYALQACAVRVSRVSVYECLETAFDIARIQASSAGRGIGYEAIVACASQGFIVAQKDGAIELMNAAAREISGVKVADTMVEVFGDAVWDKLLAGGHSQVALFGPNRAIAELRIPTQARDMRIVSIFDPPLLRRLLASSSDGHTETAETRKFEDLTAVSLAMCSVITRAAEIARGDEPMLLYGEQGTGKNSLAQAIHSASRRCRQPFWRVNAMLSADTVLNDLLGSDIEPGLLERAHGGSLYIHECWNLSLECQRTLLEVLERRAIRRKDTTKVPCDIRLALGSTRALKDQVESGKFLPELYYACQSHVLRLPALRERQDDIVPLLLRFLKREGVLEPSLTPSIERRLLAYKWPGNVAELNNFARRLACLYRAFPAASRAALEKTALDEIESELPKTKSDGDDTIVLKIGSMEFMQEQIIDQMDRLVGGNKSELARRLGISRTTLWKKGKPPNEKSGTE